MDKLFAVLGFALLTFGLVISFYYGNTFEALYSCAGLLIIFAGIGFLILAFDLPKMIKINKLVLVSGIAFLALGLIVAFYRESTLAEIVGERVYYMGLPIILGGICLLILAFLPPRKR